MFIFWPYLGMWPLKSTVLENQALFLGLQSHIYGVCKKIDQKTCILRAKPRNMTPQYWVHLRIFSHVLKVSTDIDGKSNKIDEMNMLFIVNLGMWPLKWNIYRKWAMFWEFQCTFMGFPRRFMGKCSLYEENLHIKLRPVLKVLTHIYGVSKEIDGKTFIFWVKLGMWPLKSIVSEKTSHVLRDFNTHLWGFLGDEMGKLFIFWVNLGMWPLKLSIVSEKIKSCSVGLNTHLWGYQEEWHGKISIFRVNLGMWPL